MVVVAASDVGGNGGSPHFSGTSGQPGLGLGGGIGRFPSVQFGSVDVTPPTAVNPSSVGIGRFAYHFDVQWAASTDTGSGVLGYHLYRNSTYVGFTAETTYTFGALTPATNYTIGIQAEDCAGNRSTRTNVATSTSNAPPTPPGTYPGLSSPRQVGVRATGSYWGAGGESIDMLSGNLHYGFPLVQAGARGGQSALLKLGYNSQLWRQDGGGIWKLGQDVGYGMGWRLMAGSVFPYWPDSNTLAYWIFTDASGAEYKLDKNTADVWTTTEIPSGGAKPVCTILVLDGKTGKTIQRIPVLDKEYGLHNVIGLLQMAITSTGETLAVAEEIRQTEPRETYELAVRLVDVASGRETARIVHDRVVRRRGVLDYGFVVGGIQISADDRYLFTSGRHTKAWDLKP